MKTKKPYFASIVMHLPKSNEITRISLHKNIAATYSQRCLISTLNPVINRSSSTIGLRLKTLIIL